MIHLISEYIDEDNWIQKGLPTFTSSILTTLSPKEASYAMEKRTFDVTSWKTVPPKLFCYHRVWRCLDAKLTLSSNTRSREIPSIENLLYGGR